MAIIYKTHIIKNCAAVLIALLIYSPMPAFSQQQETELRINRLENEVQTLSRAIFKGEMPPPSSHYADSAVSGSTSLLAGLELRLSQLEMEIARLTGSVEQQAYETRSIRERMDKFISGLETRVSDLEKAAEQEKNEESTPLASHQVNSDHKKNYNLGSLNATDTISPPAVTTQAGYLGVLPVTKQGELIEFTGFNGDTPADSYEQAFTILREKKYAAAEQAFNSFLELYPEHTLAGNAKYWLGETFYVQGNYERAAREFAEAYQDYPEGTKSADNLLKLGMSLVKLGKDEDACLAFSQLKSVYSHSAAGPVLNRADQEMGKLSCK